MPEPRSKRKPRAKAGAIGKTKANALEAKVTTKSRILECAVALFTKRGFDNVTTREITFAAGANIAAIDYYFGSKKDLIREAFAFVVRPVNAQRLNRLGQALENPQDNELRLEGIVRAFIEPVIEVARAPLASYHQMFFWAFAYRQPFIDQIVWRENDDVARRFVAALCAALPHLTPEDVWWRYDFAIGSLMHILLDHDRSGRLKRLSGGVCLTDDASEVSSNLMTSICASFRAPPRKANVRRRS
jgi:AcrR family transcriptional regulator